MRVAVSFGEEFWLQEERKINIMIKRVRDDLKCMAGSFVMKGNESGSMFYFLRCTFDQRKTNGEPAI